MQLTNLLCMNLNIGAENVLPYVQGTPLKKT